MLQPQQHAYVLAGRGGGGEVYLQGLELELGVAMQHAPCEVGLQLQVDVRCGEVQGAQRGWVTNGDPQRLRCHCGEGLKRGVEEKIQNGGRGRGRKQSKAKMDLFKETGMQIVPKTMTGTKCASRRSGDGVQRKKFRRAPRKM